MGHRDTETGGRVKKLIYEMDTFFRKVTETQQHSIRIVVSITYSW